MFKFFSTNFTLRSRPLVLNGAGVSPQQNKQPNKKAVARVGRASARTKNYRRQKNAVRGWGMGKNHHTHHTDERRHKKAKTKKTDAQKSTHNTNDGARHGKPDKKTPSPKPHTRRRRQGTDATTSQKSRRAPRKPPPRRTTQTPPTPRPCARPPTPPPNAPPAEKSR